MPTRIMIMDNQFSDFEIIYEKLANQDYDVFPSREDYIKVTDYIRIYLNRAYGINRNREALQCLGKYIKDNKIELLIVDYKLSGSVEGLTGIDLVIALTKGTKPVLPGMPFIFLTRTPLQVVKPKLNEAQLPDPTWIDKGFGLLHINDSGYFKEYISNEIPKVMGKSKLEQHLEIIDILMDSYPRLKEDLMQLRKEAVELGEIPAGHDELIKQCYPNVEPYIVERLIKNYKL